MVFLANQRIFWYNDKYRVCIFLRNMDSWNWECFHRMKKNEAKDGNDQSMDALTKRQMEDRVFNKMMLWLAAAAVAEGVMLVLNRFYIHIRVDEMNAYMAWYNALLVLFVAGVVLFAVFLTLGMRARKRTDELAGRDGTIQIILAAMCLTVGIGSILMRFFGSAVAPMVLAAVPGLAVLALVFHLYQKEFFGCALVGGLGILGLWIFRAAEHSAGYYGYLIFTLAVTVAGVVLAVFLQKGDGVVTVGGKKCTMLQPEAAYPAFYVTAVVTAVLLLASLALGAALAYYAIWGLAAWLFILAVYFTSKLM